MATLLNGNLNSFVKNMDLWVGWDGQTKEARQKLLNHLMDDYEIHKESSKLSEKYIKQQEGQALIQYRFSLNQFIDT